MVRDVNPQFLNMTVTETVVNTFLNQGYNTPVIHDLGTGKSLVMEILKIFMETTNIPMSDDLQLIVSATIHKKSVTSIPLFHDPNTVMRITTGIETHKVGTPADQFFSAVSIVRPMVFDLTDGDGNGYLYANKQIFVGVKGVNFPAQLNSARAKILYRLKRVSAAELLGIIQE